VASLYRRGRKAGRDVKSTQVQFPDASRKSDELESAPAIRKLTREFARLRTRIRQSERMTADDARDGNTGERLVATYTYRDEAGAVLYKKLRFDPKRFVLDRKLNGVRRVARVVVATHDDHGGVDEGGSAVVQFTTEPAALAWIDAQQAVVGATNTQATEAACAK
jgi:hypothetical protein